MAIPKEKKEKTRNLSNLGSFETFFLQMWRLFLKVFSKTPLITLLGTFFSSFFPKNCDFSPQKNHLSQPVTFKKNNSDVVPMASIPRTTCFWFLCKYFKS
jgi:hypothetical protein